MSTKDTWAKEESLLPLAQKLLPIHVIREVKRGQSGNVLKFKARVVAGGNLQREGMDFDRVYAPVIDFINTLLTLCFVFQMNGKFSI